MYHSLSPLIALSFVFLKYKLIFFTNLLLQANTFLDLALLFS